LQRLFSTFANGWPGKGLLLLRLVIGAALIYYGIADPRETHQLASIAAPIIGAGAGILILLGLWTPVVGALVAIDEVWIAFSRASDPALPIVLAALGAALAMIGPGEWSLDARLFGRKHLQIPRR
jgi:putative oxidoreductase